MKRKIKNLIIMPLVFLFAVNSYGQTLTITSPGYGDTYHCGDWINIFVSGYTGSDWQEALELVYSCLVGEPQHTNSDEPNTYKNIAYPRQEAAYSFTFSPESPSVWDGHWVKLIAHNKKNDTWSAPQYVRIVPSDDENGVVINGVRWATRNVDKPGTFVAKPEDAGMFYQWNRKIGWSATDPLINSNGGTRWDDSKPAGSTWEKANDPSPAGWRVPTFDEISTLLDGNKVSHEWTTVNGVNGRRFTDKATGNSVFLPAAGCRYGPMGGLDFVPSNLYWSSSWFDSMGADCLSFGSVGANWLTISLSTGCSVRCVKESSEISLLIVSPETYNFVPAGGGATITVSSNQSWAASSNASWCTVSPSSGNGNGQIGLEVTAYYSTSPRSATVTVTGGGITKTISVTQEAMRLDLSPTSYNFAANGGISSAITVNSNFSWNVSSNASWLTTSKTSGSYDDTFSMTATANTSNSPRSATVTVTTNMLGITKTVNVTQAQAQGNNAPANDQCTNAIDLSCGANLTGQTTVGATEKIIAGNTASKYGVWYTFTGDGKETVITADAAFDFDHKIVVFSGSCGDLTYVGSRDYHWDFGDKETYTFVTATGTKYYVYIAHSNPSGSSAQTGTFSISRTCTPSIVGPLLVTTWDQIAPYNALCPSDPNARPDCNGRVLTGCVATAMAQIMKYHEHPPQGVGSHSYTHSTYGTLSANFGDATYQWSNMPPALTAESSSDVATLMYHCGVAVEMDYGAEGSSPTKDVPNALSTYFGYDQSIKHIYQSNYKSDDWYTILRTELDAGRPIYYSGDNGVDGHAWVCDGYNSENHFHFNWGWGGDYLNDAWFLPLITDAYKSNNAIIT